MLAFLLAPSLWANSFPSQYDPHFELYAAAYLPGVDWRLLKAQCYQESRLQADAVSPAGAMGLCQFMPGTWRDMQRAHGIRQGPFNPYASIRAAALYMRQLRRTWYLDRPEWDRHSLALACYNAGLGNILAAQRLCDNARHWAKIEVCLPDVTGHHAAETRHYVPAIWRWYEAMTDG